MRSLSTTPTRFIYSGLRSSAMTCTEARAGVHYWGTAAVHATSDTPKTGTMLSAYFPTCRWEDDEQRAAIAAAAMSPGSALKKQQASPLAAAALLAAAGSSGLATGAGTFLPCSPPAQRPHSRRHASR